MNLKLIFYPAGIVVAIFVLLAIVLQRWQIIISLEPLEQQEALPLASSVHSTPSMRSTASSVTKPTPVPKLNLSVINNQKTSPSKAEESVVLPPGVMRLSNQSEHPIRIAFLAHQQATKTNKQAIYGQPAHWDFAPGEGASNGLVLSLPKGYVKLEKGDILVAFAQDGSGRYWGPYVVGNTPQPVWNQQKSEWALTLQP